MRFLACNYSREAEELLKEEKVQFDYFKYPSLEFDSRAEAFPAFLSVIDNIKRVKPVLYHGVFPNNINICHPGFKEQFNIAALKSMCERTQTPGISLHLVEADINASGKDITKTTVENVIFLKEHFKDMQFISLENTEKCSNRNLVSPDVIKEIVNETGVSFLLDISHANWSAGDRGETLSEYINKLPMDKLYEIHINGWVTQNGEQMAHLKIQEELYDFLKCLITDYPAKIVTLEYGRGNDRLGIGCPLVNLNGVNPKAKEEIEEQITRLAELVY